VTPSPSLSLVTCSFRGDFDACVLLCESADRFVPDEIVHELVVPRQDVELFAPLASSRRRITPTDAYLPPSFHLVPMPPPAWRRRLRLPRRNVYATPYSAPVRGWIAQQILKISAVLNGPADVVIHLDSDNAFIRDLDPTLILRDGKARLYEAASPVDSDSHRQWHAAACRLLGIHPPTPATADYIDQMVVWTKDQTRALTERIERTTRHPWYVTLARTRQFAEYELYGVHAREVVGIDQAGVFADSQSLCHARWEGNFADPEDIEAFVSSLQPHHVVCLLQSTLEIDLALRREIFSRVEARARKQDARESLA